MGRITKEMFEKVYEIYFTQTQDIDPVVKMGMNETSAKMTLVWYEHILNGKLYKRTASAVQIEFILEKLFNDNDKSRLALVLQSFNKYIEFYNDKQLKKVKSYIELYEGKLLEMT